jgi:hypothetical protein
MRGVIGLGRGLLPVDLNGGEEEEEEEEEADEEEEGGRRMVVTRRRKRMRKRRKRMRRRRTSAGVVTVFWVVGPFRYQIPWVVPWFLCSLDKYLSQGLPYNFHSLFPSHLDLITGVPGPVLVILVVR